MSDDNNSVPDNRDFIQRYSERSEKLTGKPASDADMVEHFQLYGLKRRVDVLEELDKELSSSSETELHEIPRRVQMREMRRRMGEVHEKLRKGKR